MKKYPTLVLIWTISAMVKLSFAVAVEPEKTEADCIKTLPLCDPS